MSSTVGCVLFLCIAVSWPIWIVAEAPRKALLFSKETNQLDEINRADFNKKCYSCITACPAISKRRRRFNRKISIGKKSIFLSKFYKGMELAKNIDLEICYKSFEPSILFLKEDKLYETGYELYYEEKKCTLESLSDSYHYYDFQSVINDTRTSRQQGHSTNFPKIESEDGKNTRFIYDDARIMSFYWIPVLSFDFNPMEFQIRVYFYGDIINNYPTMRECKDYDLGYELFKSKQTVNLFYSQPSHEKMFEQTNFESEQLADNQTSSCAHADKCLERTHLLPLIYFHTNAAKLATCTYLNTIPVWSSIINGQLKTVDRYLYTIFRLWYPNIVIIFGVSNVLTLNNVQNSISTEQTRSSGNHQNDEHQIQIPKIIYRIIEYHLPVDKNNKRDANKNDQDQNDEDDDDQNFLSHYIAIIIHNDPQASNDDRLCPLQTQSLFNDWKAIYNNDVKTGLSYACTLNDRIIEKLGAYDKAPADFTRPLYLSAFPHFDKNKPTNKFYIVDKRKTIDDEMEKLFSGNIR